MREKLTDKMMNSFAINNSTEIKTKKSCPVNSRVGESITKRFEEYGDDIRGLTAEGKILNPDIATINNNRKHRTDVVGKRNAHIKTTKKEAKR